MKHGTACRMIGLLVTILFAGPTMAANLPLKSKVAQPSATQSERTPAQAGRQNLPTGQLPRIVSSSPAPALVGRPLTIHGEHFGRRGRVQLNIGPLNLVLSPSGWTDSEITVTIPEQVASIVGEHNTSARIWVYPEHGMATANIQVAPDPSRITPIILHLSTDHLVQGGLLAIDGEHFLREKNGTVNLSCPALTARSAGIIQSWSDTRIIAKFLVAASHETRNAPCELTVCNHRGLAARKPVTFSVPFDHDTVTYRVHLREEISRQMQNEQLNLRFEFNNIQLLNGWRVRRTKISFSEDGDWRNMRFEWRTRPEPGSTNLRAVVYVNDVETGGFHSGRGIFPTEMYYKIDIEGPKGLPFQEGLF